MKLIQELQVHQIELEMKNEELKSRNDELRESEARFRLVSDNAPVLIWKAGIDALCDYFNKPWQKFTGRTMEQEMGNGWAEGVHPEDFQRCLDSYLGAFKAQQPFTMEYRLLRNDGEYRWLLDHGVPRFTPNGKFSGYIGSCVDITESKQSLLLLEQTRHNYETFFNTIDDFLFVLDEKGNTTHTNSTVIERLGYTREELFGKSALMVHPPEQCEEAGRIVGEMLGGVTAFCPVPLISKSRVQIPVVTTVSKGHWNGKPAIFGVTKDISTQRLSEENFSKKNGEIKHVLMSAENYCVQDKKYRFTVVHDITRQKQAQVQMGQISAPLSLATQTGGVGIWDFDKDTGIGMPRTMVEELF